MIPVRSSSEAGRSLGSETQDLQVRMRSKVTEIPRSLGLYTERTEGATEGGLERRGEDDKLMSQSEVFPSAPTKKY